MQIAKRKTGSQDKVIVALDVPDRAQALRLVEELSEFVGAFKIGQQLFTAEGPSLVTELVGQGLKVFLDLKFHDIPNTVAGACASAARLGVSLLNVHALGGIEMMRAAARSVAASAPTETDPAPKTSQTQIERPGGASKHTLSGLRPILLGVTVLTSMDVETLRAIGVESNVQDEVVRLARLTNEAGLDGVVASPNEIRAIREQVAGQDFVIVTPGVRPAWAETGDQKRMATPAEAIRDGADYLVIGRPITGQPDPRAAAEKILEEVGRA